MSERIIVWQSMRVMGPITWSRFGENNIDQALKTMKRRGEVILSRDSTIEKAVEMSRRSPISVDILVATPCAIGHTATDLHFNRLDLE